MPREGIWNNNGMRIGLRIMAAVWLLAMLPTGPMAKVPESTGVHYTFEAFRLEGGALVFRGEYTVERRDGVVRESHSYFNLDGGLAHQAEAVFDMNQRSPVSLREVMYPGQITREVVANGKGFTIREVDGKTGNLQRERNQPMEPGLVFWPNLISLVREQLPALAPKGKINLRLYDMESGDVVPIFLERMAGEGEGKVVGAQAVPTRLRMGVDLFLLSSILPASYLTIPAAGPETGFEYQGRSVLRKVDGSGHEYLRIVYRPAPLGATVSQMMAPR